MFMWLKLLSFSGGQEDLGSLVTMMFHVVLNLFTFMWACGPVGAVGVGLWACGPVGGLVG